MFNLGFSELLILGVLALLLIGPRQLPELARTLGRLFNEFKRATGDITSTITDFRSDQFFNETAHQHDENNKIQATVPPPADPKDPPKTS